MNLRDVDEYLRKQDADADPNEMFISDNPVQVWDDQKWSESNDDDENIVTSTFMDKTIPSTSDEKAPPVPKPSSNEAKLDHSEICDLMLESNIFAAIDRKLYVWDKNFYRFIDWEDFSLLVRKNLDSEYHSRIGGESVMKTAHFFMRTTPGIANKFSEKSFDAVKPCFAFDNGVFDGKDFSKVTNPEDLPLRFHINAKILSGGPNVPTPVLDGIILRATKNDVNSLRLFFEMLGYLLSHDTDGKRFFVIGTARDSGKSILASFISRLIGNNNVKNLPLQKLGGQFALGHMDRAAINMNMDLPNVPLSETSVSILKQLTGDERIGTEEKGIQEKSSEVRCRFVFGTNFAIQLKEDDPALWERMELLAFTESVPPEERDYNLKKKLWKERHAIVTKAFWAYYYLVKKNYQFTKSVQAEEWVRSWRGNTSGYQLQALYQDFLDSCCVVTTDKSVLTPTVDVFNRFVEFCDSEGCSYPTKNKFIENFQKFLGFEKKKKSSGKERPNCFVGITLKQSIE